VGDELAAATDKIKFFGGGNNFYNKYPSNYSQGQDFGKNQNQGMYRPPPMQNQWPRQEERQPTFQEIMLQYMAKNDK